MLNIILAKNPISSFSTLQITKSRSAKPFNLVVLVEIQKFSVSDKQLAYEAKERSRLQVERQEDSLQRGLRRKPEKLDVMSLEPRSSF